MNAAIIKRLALKFTLATLGSLFIPNALSAYHQINWWRGVANSGVQFHKAYHSDSVAWCRAYHSSECEPNSPDTRASFYHQQGETYWYNFKWGTCAGGVEPNVVGEVKDHDSDDEIGHTHWGNPGKIDDDSTNIWD